MEDSTAAFFQDENTDSNEDEETDLLLLKDEPIRVLGEVVGISCVDPRRKYYLVLQNRIRSNISAPDRISGRRRDLVFVKELALDDLVIRVNYKQKDPLNLTTWDTGLLGRARVRGDTILASQEEHVDVKLTENSILTMRFRLATDSDVAFLSKLYRNENPWREAIPTAKLVTETNEWQNLAHSVSSIFQSMVQDDSNIRVKPHPDPQRVDETTYLSKQAIKELTFAPSQKWIKAGSGSIGKLFLEILKCSNLPNLDIGGSIGNLTDCFVCAVFEDAMVQTPVIDDELSPHWMPWAQRAFCFNILHPSSLLYLGAFDFDCIGDHDPLGRVAVNLSNLQRNTGYTLTYSLYPNSHVTDRVSAGEITIRVRLEYHNERQALLTGIRSRPTFHVNVEKEKSFKVLQYTCHGEYGHHTEQTFDLTAMRSYVYEILEYKDALGYSIFDSVQSLIFWRGQVQVFEMILPLHSLVFFLSCCKLLERPCLFPAFCFLGVGWIMLVTLTQRRQHPSPWLGCPSFRNYLYILLNGQSANQFEKIEPNHQVEKIDAYEKEWKDRVERDQKHLATLTELQEELDALGDVAIHTKQNGITIPLVLVERLSRYQGMIAQYCRYMRVVKIIVTWEDGVISFWITSCFLLAGIVGLMLPWEFLLKWSMKLIVYGLLGPHMMVVDSFLGRSSHDDKLFKAIEQLRKESETARHRRQDALKLKDAKCLAFGKYITVVPSFNNSRHHDRPLPCSHAQAMTVTCQIPLSDHCIPGQQISGKILPRTEVQKSRFEKERPELDRLMSAVESCLCAIKENESSELLKSLRERSIHFEERNMPDSMGFEIIDGGLGLSPSILLHECKTQSVGLRRRRRSSLLRIEQSENSVQNAGAREDSLHIESISSLESVSWNSRESQRCLQQASYSNETSIEICIHENQTEVFHSLTEYDECTSEHHFAVNDHSIEEKKVEDETI